MEKEAYMHVNIRLNKSEYYQIEVSSKEPTLHALKQETNQKRELRLHLHFLKTFWEKSPSHKLNPNVMKNAIEILGLVLQRPNKFLKGRENEELLYVQSIGPDGMDGGHQWSTIDRLTSSQ